MVTFNVDDSIDSGPFDIAISKPTGPVRAPKLPPGVLHIPELPHSDDASFVDDCIVSPPLKRAAAKIARRGDIIGLIRLRSEAPPPHDIWRIRRPC